MESRRLNAEDARITAMRAALIRKAEENPTSIDCKTISALSTILNRVLERNGDPGAQSEWLKKEIPFDPYVLFAIITLNFHRSNMFVPEQRCVQIYLITAYKWVCNYETRARRAARSGVGQRPGQATSTILARPIPVRATESEGVEA